MQIFTNNCSFEKKLIQKKQTLTLRNRILENENFVSNTEWSGNPGLRATFPEKCGRLWLTKMVTLS